MGEGNHRAEQEGSESDGMQIMAYQLKCVILGLISIGLTFEIANADRTPLSEKDFSHGVYLLEQGETDDALRHLKNIPLSYPKSVEAPDSLRLLAEIYLDRGQYDLARTAIDRVVTEYPEYERASYCTILSHLISLHCYDLRDAINRRVQIDGLVSNSPASVEANLARLIIAKLALSDRDLPRAELYLTQLLLRLHSGFIYREALWNFAILKLLQDQPMDAMITLQKLSDSTSDSMVRDRALANIERLNNLYIENQTALIRTSDFEFGELGSKGPVDINVSIGGKLTVLDRNPIQVTFDTRKPAPGISKSVPPKSLRLNVGLDDALLTITGNQIVCNDAVLFSSASHSIRNLVDAIWTNPGEYWILDKSAQSYMRFDKSRQSLGSGPKMRISGKEHLVRNPIGGTWILSPSSDTIYLFNARGTDFQEVNLQLPDTKKVEPIDCATDELGHLYVLDRNQHILVVYAPSFKRIKSFSIETQDFRLRSPIALAIDLQGRYYIADQKFKVIYQFK